MLWHSDDKPQITSSDSQDSPKTLKVGLVSGVRRNDSRAFGCTVHEKPPALQSTSAGPTCMHALNEIAIFGNWLLLYLGIAPQSILIRP